MTSALRIAAPEVLPDHPPVGKPDSFPPRPGGTGLSRIVALSDGSMAGDNAAWRAALLARERSVSLRLLHVLGRGRADAGGIDAIAWELQERVGVPVEGIDASGWARHRLHEALAAAELLVTPTLRSRSLRRWLRGVHPLQLVGRATVPVLVVRRPASVRYGRILAAAGETEDSAGVLALAGWIAGGDFAAVRRAVLAAYGQEAECASSATDRFHLEQRLRGAIQDALKAQPGRTPEAPVVALEAHVDGLLQRQRQVLSDLLVIGPCACRQAARAYGRVLRHATADVLVVPGSVAAEIVAAPVEGAIPV